MATRYFCFNSDNVDEVSSHFYKEENWKGITVRKESRSSFKTRFVALIYRFLLVDSEYTVSVIQEHHSVPLHYNAPNPILHDLKNENIMSHILSASTEVMNTLLTPLFCCGFFTIGAQNNTVFERSR